MGGGVYTGFISLYWADLRLDHGRIGLLGAVGAMAAIVFQPWWGLIVDGSRSKTRMLQLTVFLTAAIVWLLPLAGTDLRFLLAAVMLFTCFNNAVGPLADTVSLELAASGGFPFAPIRMAGSLGFAVMSAAAGLVLGARSFLIFPIFSAARIVAGGLSLGLPDTACRAAGAGKLPPFRDLYRDRNLALMHGYAFVLSCAWAFMLNFHAIRSREVGIPLGLVGLCIGLGSLSQFPFMAWFGAIRRRFSLRTILLASGAMYAVRMLLFGAALHPATVVPIWLLHGFNYILVYLCLAEYVGSTVHPELRARGQMANAIVLGGVSALVGNAVGGEVASSIGLGATFMAFSAVCAAAVAAFAVLSRRLEAPPPYRAGAV